MNSIELLYEKAPQEVIIDSFRGEYRFLSNFEVETPLDYKIMLDGEPYKNVEAAYQAAKTYNTDERKLIQNALTPAKAKKLGQEVTLRKDWENIKLQVMYDCLIQKFSYPYFKKLLIATHPKILVEGNTWNDTFFGVGKNNLGKNNLGKLLMIIREKFINENNNLPTV